mmetsp:Transcript_26080/g.66189  ORF Transcript_26080/g.66189 Transcript_26080/m.66189 type:complete len:134 (-) Transcript_26080:1038-1439(-)
MASWEDFDDVQPAAAAFSDEEEEEEVVEKKEVVQEPEEPKVVYCSDNIGNYKAFAKKMGTEMKAYQKQAKRAYTTVLKHFLNGVMEEMTEDDVKEFADKFDTMVEKRGSFHKAVNKKIQVDDPDDYQYYKYTY